MDASLSRAGTGPSLTRHGLPPSLLSPPPQTPVSLVGISNAFNRIDGMDGLAGGVAIIGLLATLTAGLLLGNPTVPIYTIALIGALIGFLRYNWPSAKLFMGDSGSLVVGFLL